MSDTHHRLPTGYEIVRDNGQIVRVQMTCVGCGEEIDTIPMFEDRLSSLEGRPVHDKINCAQKARGGAR